MINLSIVNDPVWILEREECWLPVRKYLSENLRKKDLEKIHNYFMTGRLRPGEEMSDGAKFGWFPIQTVEAWNYLFQYVVKDIKEYEFWFYFSFEDLSHRGLNQEQELALWDYFAGYEFKPVVTSRVPVGETKEFVSFEVDKWNVAANFWDFLDKWAEGKKHYTNFKMTLRFNYLVSMLSHFNENEFSSRKSNGSYSERSVYCVDKIFHRICHPFKKLESESKLQGDDLKEFEEAILNFKELIDASEMPPFVRELWEKIKLEG